MADPVETAEHFIYVTQVYFCCMYSVVLWDWLISLPREWRFIWKTRWTPVKIAYLFCRYWVIMVVPYLLFAFVTDHTEEACKKIFRVPVALAMWNQVGSESVLLIRTYAFFNRNNYLLVALVCALSGVVAYQLYVDNSEMILLPFVKPPYGPCFPASKPRSAHLLGFFIAPLLFDTIVTAMTVWKALHIRIHTNGPSSKLIQTFLREGVFYYILISIANLINGIFYLQPRQVISAINIPLSVMMAPLLACRLILDLRERGAETVSHSEDTGIGAFATKSGVTLPTARHPGKRGRTRYRGAGSTMTSNVVLSTVGSIQPDLEAADMELDEMHFQCGMDFVDDSTRTLETLGNNSPAPAYDSVEGSLAGPPGSECDASHLEEVGHGGVRIEIQKTMCPL